MQNTSSHERVIIGILVGMLACAGFFLLALSRLWSLPEAQKQCTANSAEPAHNKDTSLKRRLLNVLLTWESALRRIALRGKQIIG